MNRSVKIGLILFILFVMNIPLIQQFVGLKISGDELYGYFDSAKDTTFTSSAWFSKEYQLKKDKYLNENFGFRRLLVRITNQINFSLNWEIKVFDIFKGKENYLFNQKFYKEYAGIACKKESAIDSVCRQLNQLNDWLKVRNKKLIICLAPCKESYNPEFLPASYLEKVKQINNYSLYKSRFEKDKLTVLDLNEHFLNVKEKTEHPIFNQGGIHWTIYGASLALDTMLKYMAVETGKKINQIKFPFVELSETPRASDDDILKPMNIFSEINAQVFAYPFIEYVYPQDSCYKPKVMIVGDSFFYGLFNTWIPLAFFSKDSYFLYYFREAFSFDERKKGVKIKELNFSKELENTDVLIFFFSIGNLSDFPYGSMKMLEDLKKE